MAENKEYISGEQHSQMSGDARGRKKVTMRVSYIYGAVIVLVLCIVCFAIGDVYGKHHGTTSQTAATSRFGGSSTGFGGRQGGMGDFGTVSSVSSTSITVENTRTNASTTYTVNSSTSITNDGETGSISDIQSGDRVIITTASTTSKVATKIEINPSFGGGMGGPGAAAGSATSGSGTTGSASTGSASTN
jgi:hypothetical protein